MRIADGPLERVEVDFAHGTFGHADIDAEAVGLLVVQHEMLQTAGHPVGLGSPDVGHHHFGGQHGVLAHVLECTSVERCALDVDTGTQHDILATEGKLLADGMAIERGEVAVPGGCQTRQRGEGHNVVVSPAGWAPCVPLQFLAYAVGAVVHVELSDAKPGDAGRGELTLCMEHFDFLLSSHAAQCIFDALFDRCRRVQIGLALDSHGGCQDKCCYHQVSFLHSLLVFIISSFYSGIKLYTLN